jgi:hypothetical protein
LDLRVIEGVEIKLPDRSVKYLRVVPPVAPQTPQQPAQPAVTPAALTAEQVAAEGARAKKKREAVLLSATVFDRRVTELRLQTGERQVVAWSNVDFNHFTGMAEVETEDAIYWLMMSLDNQSQNTAENAEKKLPAPDRFRAGRAEYFVNAGEKEPPPPEALAALDALHRFYDANRERLAAAHVQREAEKIVQAQKLRDNPPAPKDTTIYFWPKKSSNYPTSNSSK